jgi:hypothetical protein
MAVLLFSLQQADFMRQSAASKAERLKADR